MSDVLPPPPPPRGDSGCWKWGAIACGGGCALATLVIVLTIIFAGPTIKKTFNTAFKLSQETMQCQTEITSLWRKVELYHSDKGAYPDKLGQLVPKYVPGKSDLKFSAKPEGPEFTYHKPTKNGAPTDIVLEYELTITAPDGKTIPFPIRIMKNGQLEANSFNFQYQNQPGGTFPTGTGNKAPSTP
jgi:hypothetical protein